MSVANGLVDSPLWVEQEYRHNRTEPFAAMSRRLPLWLAATCLVGALCQPDVQGAVRQQLQETAEAIEHGPTTAGGPQHPSGPVSAGPAEGEPRLDPAAAALVERVVATMAAGRTGDGVAGAAAPAPAGPPARTAVAKTVAHPDHRDPTPRHTTAPHATARQLVPPNGRLADGYVIPAQRALARHISAAWRVPDAQIQRYVGKVWRTAGELEVDPFLVLAVMATESSFNHRAQSSRGAQGLMQVHTRVHKDKFKAHGGPQRAFDPDASIRVGSLILKQYLDRYGSPRGALKAYVGAANLKSDGGYASKVLRRHAEFKQVVRTELVRLAASGKLDAGSGQSGSMTGSGRNKGKDRGSDRAEGRSDGDPTRVAASAVNPVPATR